MLLRASRSLLAAPERGPLIAGLAGAASPVSKDDAGVLLGALSGLVLRARGTGLGLRAALAKLEMRAGTQTRWEARAQSLGGGMVSVPRPTSPRAPVLLTISRTLDKWPCTRASHLPPVGAIAERPILVGLTAS